MGASLTAIVLVLVLALIAVAGAVLVIGLFRVSRRPRALPPAD